MSPAPETEISSKDYALAEALGKFSQSGKLTHGSLQTMAEIAGLTAATLLKEVQEGQLSTASADALSASLGGMITSFKDLSRFVEPINNRPAAKLRPALPDVVSAPTQTSVEEQEEKVLDKKKPSDAKRAKAGRPRKEKDEKQNGAGKLPAAPVLELLPDTTVRPRTATEVFRTGHRSEVLGYRTDNFPLPPKVDLDAAPSFQETALPSVSYTDEQIDQAKAVLKTYPADRVLQEGIERLSPDYDARKRMIRREVGMHADAHAFNPIHHKLGTRLNSWTVARRFDELFQKHGMFEGENRLQSPVALLYALANNLDPMTGKKPGEEQTIYHGQRILDAQRERLLAPTAKKTGRY
ncbi:MAG: hypothetical protein U1E36_00315 [Rickettsiales bacterium]